MLQQFTWQHFLVAALVLSLIWYVVVWFRFYRQRIKMGNGIGRTPLDRLVANRENDAFVADSDEMMGKPRLPEGLTIVGSEEVRFAGDGTKADQIGLIPDLLEDLKLLFQKIAERDGSKADFLRMLENVKSGYPKMGNHPQLAAVNEFIVDHAPFHLTPADIENLWD